MVAHRSAEQGRGPRRGPPRAAARDSPHLAWANGMIDILDLGLNVIAYRVDGRVDSADIDRLFEEIDVRLATGGKFRVYVEVPSISGISLDALLKDVRLGLQRLDVLRRIEKAALVTDNQWLRMAAMIDDRVLRGVHIRVFRLAEQVEARTWIQSDVTKIA
jgi:hypothetical protein